jgi:VanZ family protein
VTSGTRPLRAPELRWSIWIVGLAVYTYLLLAPDEWLPSWLRQTVEHKITPGFSFGKLAHGVTYGALTLWTFLLPVKRTGWIFCVVVLALHGVMTEYIQTYIPGRHGRWQDVVTDYVGIAGGLLLGWLCARSWAR